MPYETHAYKVCEDGSIHESFDAALEHETRIKLRKLNLDLFSEEPNEAMNELIDKCIDLVEVLGPLAKERRASATLEARHAES